MKLQVIPICMTALLLCILCGCKNQGTPSVVLESRIIESTAAAGTTDLPQNASQTETSLDKGTQRKTTENELPSLTQCTA